MHDVNVVDIDLLSEVISHHGWMLQIQMSFLQELKKFGKPKLPANAFMLFIRSSRLERGNAHPTVSSLAISLYYKVHLPKK